MKRKLFAVEFDFTFMQRQQFVPSYENYGLNYAEFNFLFNIHNTHTKNGTT